MTEAEPWSSDVGERLARQEARLRLVLTHLAGRAIRARVDLDDLVQEVYLRALSHGQGLPAPEEGELALGRYLRTVARHTVVDAARAIRTCKRDGKLEHLVHSDWSRLGPRASQILARELGPATRVADRESRRVIEASFETLAAEHRRVIGLRQFEGLSAREAATRMGRSETAIHSLYRRALAAWEEKLADSPEGAANPARLDAL